MDIILEEPPSKFKKVIALIIFFSLVGSSFVVGINLAKGKVEAKTRKEKSYKADSLRISFINGNTILPISSPLVKENEIKRIKMVITAYSSDPWQTDDTPFITASGIKVKEGIVANNLLPFGTKIKIPSIYGNKIFVVEDRMNPNNSYYHIDIWFPDYWSAKKFGTQEAVVEILH